MPDGSTEAWAYDPLTLRLASATDALGRTSRYFYDALGNRLMAIDALNNTNTYDPIYRLTNWLAGQLVGGTVPLPTTTQAWQLDCLGNWNITITNGVTLTRTHDAANEITSIDATQIYHDANGNLTNDGRYAYIYDAENRLIGATQLAEAKVVGQYAYDALNRRMLKIASAAASTLQSLFFWDEWRVLEEQEATGETQINYTYGNYLKETLTMNRGGQSYYYLHRALWSPTTLTDRSGVALEHYVYAPYGVASIFDGVGNPVQPNAWGTPHSGLSNSHMFTGQEFGEEIGLSYFGYRWHAPDCGRWLSRDPLGMLFALNLYEFCSSSPMVHLDSLGLEDVSTQSQRPFVIDQRGADQMSVLKLKDEQERCKKLIDKAKEHPDKVKAQDLKDAAESLKVLKKELEKRGNALEASRAEVEGVETPCPKK